jgi:hypothetical protein
MINASPISIGTNARGDPTPPLEAEHGAEHHRDADDAHHAPDPRRAGRLREHRHPGRHDHPAADALQHPEDDQRIGEV